MKHDLVGPKRVHKDDHLAGVMVSFTAEELGAASDPAAILVARLEGVAESIRKFVRDEMGIEIAEIAVAKRMQGAAE